MISIIIPTHGNPSALYACLASVRKYTDLANVEAVIIANGSEMPTIDYTDGFRVVWFDKELDISRAYNEGIKNTSGDIIILLDDDCTLLPQDKNVWISKLLEPFVKDRTGSVGAVSPFGHYYRDIGNVVHSGCTAYRRSTLNAIGGFDESYGKQFFMDSDVSARISEAGYEVVTIGNPTSVNDVYMIDFPVYHPAKDREGIDSRLFMRNYEKFYHRNSKFKPKTSIVIPSYKGEHLTKCINSIISNTTTPIEIIVVANGLPQPSVDWVFRQIGVAKETDTWRIRLLLYDEPLGFPKAINEGIKNANGEYIVLMNDDVQILDWGKDSWLSFLTEPFKNPKVAITGPVKFSFNCGEVEWDSMGFSLVAIPKRVFDDIGLLDEVFTPGAGEDGDFSIRAQVYGYSILRVPTDIAVKFGDGGFDVLYPIYHVGSATWATLEGASESNVRNKEILNQRWGNAREVAYHWTLNNGGDIKEHIPTLRKYAEKVRHVTEFGVRDFVSTYGLLGGKPKKMISYDIVESANLSGCVGLCANEGLNWSFVKGDTLSIEIEATDLLFIDTLHNYVQLRQELELHSKKVSQYILLHDTTSFEHISETDLECTKGLWDAVEEFLKEHNEWSLKERYTNCNGLTVLERVKPMARKVSIVIPTWNHTDDLLDPCIRSILRNTSDKYELEFIVISNGSTDNVEAYCIGSASAFSSTPTRQFKYKIISEQIGFTKAANIGFKMATADHVIILNNDTEILDWGGKDVWLDKMFAPFDADVKCAATGPLKIYDFYSNREFLVGFCVMFRVDVLKQFNYFDEEFAPAGGEDVDLAIRLQDGGWKIESVQKTVYNGSTNTGDFPMWHKDNRSYGQLPIYTQQIVKRNGHLNCKRHNKNIRLNLGGGGINYKGYLNVDLFDKRADILMDISAPMDFATDSVTEILASHLFEHLNPYKALDILKEWLRILKPGGKLIMEMPDIEKLCARFTTASTGERYGILNAVYGSVNTTGEGDPSEITSPHLFGWWKQSLFDHLSNAGYVNIKFMDEQIPHPESNLRVEAMKDGIPGQSLPPVVMSDNIEDARHVTIIQDTVIPMATNNVPPPSPQESYDVLVNGTTSVESVLKSFGDRNDITLNIESDGKEYSFFMDASPDNIRRFKTITAKINDKHVCGRSVGELVKFLADVGFNPTDQNQTMMYTEVDANGEKMMEKLLSKVYKFERSESGPVEYVENPGNPYGVTAYISTKDRYFTTLPLAIMGIANQTFKVDELIIFDDGEQKDLRQESLYSNIFRYLEMKGISWKVLFGERKGQVANHQRALELAKTEYIWRVDDDNYPETEVLARLMLWLTCPVETWEQPFGAVGSLVRVPNQEIFPLEKCSGDINKCVDTPNLQWSAFSGVLHTDHLHNTFLYRKSAAKHGYPKDLSPVGHREETMFTHGIKMNGYRLLVCGDVITWHFRESKGGIRSYNDAKLWEHDEEIFKTEMKKRGLLFDNKKYVVLDNGIGDHYVFKHVLPIIIQKYGKENVVLATCYPEVFKDDGVRQISIAEATALFGDITKFNIYHWMWRVNWKKSMIDAFNTMYIL